MNSLCAKSCLLIIFCACFIFKSPARSVAEQDKDSHYSENIIPGLINKGKEMLDNGEFDSLDLLLRSIYINYYSQLKDDPLINSEYYILKGEYLNITGNNDVAINIFNQIKNEYENTENINHKLLIQIYNDLGDANQKKTNYREAENYYMASLEICRKNCMDNTFLVDILGRIVNLHIFIGNVTDAREYFNRCVYLIDSLGYPKSKELFDTYITCSLYYSMLCYYDKSIEFLDIAESILTSNYSSTHYKYCIIYYFQGRAMMHMNKLDRAMVYFEKSLKMAEKSDALNKYIYLSYDKLAYIFNEKDEYVLSNEYYLKSLGFIKNIGISPVYSYYSIGLNYSLLNDFEKSEYYYNLAEREAKNQPGKANKPLYYIYLAKSFLYKIMKEFGKEKKYLDMAYDVASKDNVYRNREMAIILRELGRYYSRMGEYQRALDTIQKGLIAVTNNFNSTDIYENPEFDDAYDKYTLIETFKRKAYTLNKYYGEVSKDIRDIKAKFECYKMAAKLEEKVYTIVSDESSRINYLSKQKITLNNSVWTAIKIYELTNDRKYLEEAFIHSEKSKALMLVSYINEEKAKKFADIPDSLINYELKIKNEIAGLNFMIDAAGEKEHTSFTETDAMKSRLFELKQKEEKLINLLEKKFPRYYDLKYNRSATPVGHVQSSLENDQALIEYTVTWKELCTFVVTRDTFACYMQEKPDSFAEKIHEIRKMLTDNKYGNYDIEDYSDFVRLSHNLYKILVEPVVNEIKDKRIIIVPDEVINLIPFEVLITDNAHDSNIADFSKLPYLVRDYPVSYAYSASLLMNRGTQKNKKDRLISFVPEYKDIYYTGHQENDTAFSDMPTLYPLVGTKEEANFISKLYKSRIYKNKHASEENFKKYAGNYNIIHLAMHTIIDDKDPMYSKMVFTPHEKSSEDGLLHTFELFGTKLDANLVVLSGCNTGYGKIQKGEGLLSLARGFVFAGCSGLLLTQWSVADRASLELMKKFYTHLSHGNTKDKAMQLAKIDYLESADPLKTHPYYWAGYIVFGNTCPLPPKRGTGRWVFAAGLILIVSLVYIVIKKRMAGS
jgi:CHAT domain-containing protein/tetratricopeptide (TPR) repeat protein